MRSEEGVYRYDTVTAEGDTAAFDTAPTLGSGYDHITTNSAETEVYGWTGKTEAEETWDKTALKIQPFVSVNDDLTVTATPKQVAPDDTSTLKAERTFDLGNSKTLVEDVTAKSTWTLDGGNSGTKIDKDTDSATLTVAADEAAEKLTVTATYTDDKTYTGITDVTVTTAPPTVTGISVATQPTKLSYTAGETLDLTGLAVKITYSNGTGDGSTFSPNQDCTRAEILTLLYRLAGSPAVTYTGSFSDVEAGQWYTDAIAWAAANGVTTGTNDSNIFEPNKTCTRAEIIVFMYRIDKGTAAE